MKVLLTGGGTGGHVTPLVALIREMRRIYRRPAGKPPDKQDLQFFYLGPKDEFADIMLGHENVVVSRILAGKIRRYRNWKTFLQNVFDVFIKTPAGIAQAFVKIFVLAPDIIFSKGGYGALPVTVAGWLLKTPIFLHESDAKPGLANLIASRFALKIFTSFENTLEFPAKKVTYVGNLIRREMLEGSPKEAKKLFNIVGDRPLILIIGGSQGSQRINNMVLEMLDETLKQFELIHIVGERNVEDIKGQAKTVINPASEKYYHPIGFLREVDLRHVYALADLVISRAGAGTIFELAALAKPSILIPLPESAQQHQAQNSYKYAEKGAALVIEEPNLKPNLFLERLQHLFSHPEELQKMSQAALAFAKPEAAAQIANFLIEYLIA